MEDSQKNSRVAICEKRERICFTRVKENPHKSMIYKGFNGVFKYPEPGSKIAIFCNAVKSDEIYIISRYTIRYKGYIFAFISVKFSQIAFMWCKFCKFAPPI